jgi:antitoxin YefM
MLPGAPTMSRISPDGPGNPGLIRGWRVAHHAECSRFDALLKRDGGVPDLFCCWRREPVAEADTGEVLVREQHRRSGRALTPQDFLVILLTMTVLPLGEVKSHLSELVGRVHDHHERVTVTVHGRPSAVLVALEDLERLEETLEILQDPETLKRLASSDAELARGESVSAEELAETIRRRQSK